MNVDFKFNIDEKVITPLGQEGIITNAVSDNGNIKGYWVNTVITSQYYREDQLKKAE